MKEVGCNTETQLQIGNLYEHNLKEKHTITLTNKEFIAN